MYSFADLTPIIELFKYTHWLWGGDDPNYPDDVGMFELSHDGSLLQELHPFLLCWLSLQWLHGYLHFRAAARGGGAPHTTIHCPKLTTAKVLLKSVIKQ